MKWTTLPWSSNFSVIFFPGHRFRCFRRYTRQRVAIHVHYFLCAARLAWPNSNPLIIMMIMKKNAEEKIKIKIWMFYYEAQQSIIAENLRARIKHLSHLCSRRSSVGCRSSYATEANKMKFCVLSLACVCVCVSRGLLWNMRFYRR